MISSPLEFQSKSERCINPSISPGRPINKPNSVIDLTSPSTSEPIL